MVIRMKDVYMDFGCFANLLASSIEVYDVETFGFLGGFHTGRRIYIKTSYPMQLAIRRPDEVVFGETKEQIESYNRAKKALDSLGLPIIGVYHSHPRVTGKLSNYDIKHAMEEVKNLKKKSELPYGIEKWLEIVVEIKRTKKDKAKKYVATYDDKRRIIGGYLEGRRFDYQYKLLGYWLDVEELEYNEWPNIEMANLNLDPNTLPPDWTT
jgi:proteasome lid subunit RPN8/RPN11